MMSAGQGMFKDQLLSLDDDVQGPFLEAAYHWNMQFNPKDEIKGDFNVVVKGTSSLVAREIRAQNLDQFANSTLNQFDAPFIDRHALNKQRAIVLELGSDIVRDKDQSMLLLAQQLLEGGTENAGPTNPNTTPAPTDGAQLSDQNNPFTPGGSGNPAVPQAAQTSPGSGAGNDFGGQYAPG
jgi:hypothetical protein